MSFYQQEINRIFKTVICTEPLRPALISYFWNRQNGIDLLMTARKEEDGWLCELHTANDKQLRAKVAGEFGMDTSYGDALCMFTTAYHQRTLAGFDKPTRRMKSRLLANYALMSCECNSPHRNQVQELLG